MISIVDLTKSDITCVEHPIIKLVKILNELKDEEVIVIVSKNDIPSSSILELLAKKMNFKIENIYEDDNIIKVKFVKVDRSEYKAH